MLSGPQLHGAIVFFHNQQFSKYLQTNVIVRIWRNIVVDKCSVNLVRGESSTVRREFVGLRRTYLAEMYATVVSMMVLTNFKTLLNEAQLYTPGSRGGGTFVTIANARGNL